MLYIVLNYLTISSLVYHYYWVLSLLICTLALCVIGRWILSALRARIWKPSYNEHWTSWALRLQRAAVFSKQS